MALTHLYLIPTFQLPIQRSNARIFRSAFAAAILVEQWLLTVFKGYLYQADLYHRP